ncbi:MAG TPA: phosphatase, partial [Candidatus Merdenecus merdavium]|nr:phosphatase [Candidatus Merdenecus merdavium]
TCHDFYFSNLKVVPRQMYGVELLFGVELNIIDYEGHVDMDERLLKEMEIVIASLHPPCIPFGTKEENTNAVIGAMKNSYVDIIGHPDDSRYPLDYRRIVKAAKDHHVLLELNNTSLSPGGSRENPIPNDMEMLQLCMKYQVPIVVGSDAHVDTDVGGHDHADQLLRSLDFPKELIINKSIKELKTFLNKYKN